MSKIPTKYIEKMYNDVIRDGKKYSCFKQKSSYYGTNGIVWELVNTGDRKIQLIHYGTVILTIKDGTYYICSGAYSMTDLFAIKGLLYMFGLYDEIDKIHKKEDKIYRLERNRIM